MGWAKIVFTDQEDGTVAVGLELNEEISDNLPSHRQAVDAAELIAKVAKSYEKTAQGSENRIVTIN